MTPNHSLTVYHASPDVFRRDYQAFKTAFKGLCLAAGIFPLCPADDELVDAPGKPLSLRIYEQNIALIERADIVMANVQNFRGFEPDSGTVFEIGYAIGRGKRVWCYNAPAGSLLQQIPCDSDNRDKDGYQVEDFGLSRNLMLSHACEVVAGDAKACIDAIVTWRAQFTTSLSAAA